MTQNNLSGPALASINAESTDEVWLVLITISHPSMDSPIRVVNDFNNLVSAGQNGVSGPRLFVGLPFQIILPDDDSQNSTMAVLKVDNVDQSIVASVRALDSYPTCDIEVVLASQPDIVEVAFYEMQMRTVDFDQLYVTGQLTYEQIFVEPIALDQTPARFPGIF